MALEDLLKEYHQQQDDEKRKKEEARLKELEKRKAFEDESKQALKKIILPKFKEFVELFNKNEFAASIGEGKPASDKTTALTVEKNSHNMHLNVAIQPEISKINFYFSFNTGSPSKQYNLSLQELTPRKVEDLVEQNFKDLLLSMKGKSY